MSSSAKRVLTDEKRESLIASSSGINNNLSPELSALLRSVGSRVRKNVTEGYVTSNSTYSRAYSTGSIFRSGNDTLRDVLPSRPIAMGIRPPISSRKRTRSESATAYGSDDDEAMEDVASGSSGEGFAECKAENSNSEPASGLPHRPVRALRKPRKLTATCSLPSGSLFSRSNVTPSDTVMRGLDLDEDDWSTVPFGDADSNETSYKPTVLF